ncbi:hypothetical protein [Streptacidiphilus neutrinimicus]|uniref:hypothetical protein n=1 Tax=Streptacidiphilus neutrinimicus TaxID=105420 RepID=UPI0005A81300|nr:hypothetical protein [Streptacidiphilus neutrinimicus]
MTVRRPVLALTTVLLAAALAGCSHVSGDAAGGRASAGASAGGSQAAGDAAGPLAEGPGPQSHYTVASQPAADSCHYGDQDGQPLPDARCTPGAVSPAVTQADLGDTICRKGGYTGGIRPPASVTDAEKRRNAASYDFTGSLHDAEYDHLISLELGGDPNDPRNLWVEPPSPGHKPGAGPNNPKDAIEAELHTAVCGGKVTLAQAQQAIASDWVTAESRLGLK